MFFLFFSQAFISFNNIKNNEIGFTFRWNKFWWIPCLELSMRLFVEWETKTEEALISGEVYHSVLIKLATAGKTKQPLAKTKQTIKKQILQRKQQQQIKAWSEFHYISQLQLTWLRRKKSLSLLILSPSIDRLQLKSKVEEFDGEKNHVIPGASQ